MKVLIVGSGGREHAIAWKVSQSKKVDKIYCAPGNAGISELAECVAIGAMEIDKLVAFAKEKAIDLTIIGMDDPLVAGIVDAFEAEGLRVFGPRKNAAILEGSKAFSKDLMKKYNIPTAAYEVFTEADKAIEYLESKAEFPIVLKADGLALGKGVLICEDLAQAKEGVAQIMTDKKFGSAGNKMVIESFMTGREVSVLSFVDGNTIRIMTSAQDHKRAKDGDQGLNTGGMGTFSPSPFYTKEVDEFCKKYIYQATVDAMKAEGREFKGIIFFGLMLTPNGPKVLEYNARFGDPEAQVVIPRMKNDIVEVMEACIDGTLNHVELEFEDNAAVCVVLASDGYPVAYEKGKVISGLERFKDTDNYYVFHAGTKLGENGEVLTNGGRVLGVVAKGTSLKQARLNAYSASTWIEFENKYMRHDIGKAIDEAEE
ncbi:Phosphoribosylamine--glycine ligase [Lachnospiraceae bacterium TWA4]|nr:Phosphoribosylamine--glycine ligase [Lachnospiraceae bacterium TWA4]